jgi:hypothetical protein
LPPLWQTRPHGQQLFRYVEGQTQRSCSYRFSPADHPCSHFLFGIGKSVGSPPPPPSEGCNDSNGEDESEVQLNAAALKCPDSLHTLISFPDFPSLSSTGLVDSGSSHCFADPNFISLNSIPSYEIPPVILRLLDRSIGTMITRAADITIRFTTNDILRLKFYITKLDSTSAFVFGHNWLHRYNPSIDWSAGQIVYF